MKVGQCLGSYVFAFLKQISCTYVRDDESTVCLIYPEFYAFNFNLYVYIRIHVKKYIMHYIPSALITILILFYVREKN